MKQQKGRDYKPIRQFTDEDRKAKKRLSSNIKKSIIKGDLDEDKIDLSASNKGEKS